MCITSEDVQYKQGRSSKFDTWGTTQKYFPMNESLLLLKYPVKQQSLTDCKNQLIRKY